MITAINGTFAKMGRGLRVRRKRDVQPVVHGTGGAQPQTDAFFPATWNIMNTPTFTGLVQGDATAWKYDANACNLYIFDGFRQALDASLPPPSQGYFSGGIGDSSNNLIVCGTFSEDPMVHEFCHWLGLQHTFLDGTVPVTGPALWKDDGFSDTLIDSGVAFRTLDDFAREDFGFQALYSTRTPRNKLPWTLGFGNTMPIN